MVLVAVLLYSSKGSLEALYKRWLVFQISSVLGSKLLVGCQDFFYPYFGRLGGDLAPEISIVVASDVLENVEVGNIVAVAASAVLVVGI